MGVLITILIIAALAGGVWWNHQNAKKAVEGVSFVVPYPPSAVAAALDRAHNQGAMAAIRGTFGGVSVSALGPSGFATNSKMGDSGEISISRDPAGSLVAARALSLYVGMPPKQLNHRGGIWGMSVNMSHGIYKLLGITPGSAKLKRWQNGLEGRLTKTLAKATS